MSNNKKANYIYQIEEQQKDYDFTYMKLVECAKISAKFARNNAFKNLKKEIKIHKGLIIKYRKNTLSETEKFIAYMQFRYEWLKWKSCRGSDTEMFNILFEPFRIQYFNKHGNDNSRINTKPRYFWSCDE
ncbi:hypothetical protein [Methylovorus glucosotrophus]|uniref:Uncharacterized protein n=1 Tax=Methylovorus glucosotrophus (strain SIP3-4) TaxID=582744 RepID=C6X7T0_METGS|nr:hypothetical protein [Methylovorus glucosotrophus]ACT51257.1 hypothetical protein Msip34_2015 [Methylovorus glucosotrophus SIP3-4]